MELFTKKDEGQANNAQAQPNSGLNLFSKPNAPQVSPATYQSADMSQFTRKLRINEERVMNVRRKVQMIEHNMLLSQKKVIGEIKFINQEIAEIKRTCNDLKSHIQQLSHEVEQNARKEDIQVLERYINMWEPVNFVTRKEVERIIEEKMHEMRK